MSHWLATLIVCTTIIWLSERFGGLIRARYGSPLVETPDPMPADLAAFVESHPEGWAKDDVSRALYEMYAETRSWDATRIRFLSS